MKPITYLLGLALMLPFAPARSQTAPPQPTTTVAILVYPGVELLDFAGPLEVFSLMERSQVFTVAAQPGTLPVMENVLTITPDYTLANSPQPDILVVPGASGEAIRQVLGDTAVIDWIQRTTAGRQLTMSVCTGAYVLAKAGLLAGKTATTHWGSTRMLKQMYPTTNVLENTRFVADGKLLTTAGVSAGIDGALHVVAQLRGKPAARSIAELIAYEPYDQQAGVVVGQQPDKPRSVKKTPKRPAPAPVKPVAISAPTPPLAADGIDPVCRMHVAKGTTPTAVFGGKQYGFCSGVCHERFVKEPGRYVTKSR